MLCAVVRPRRGRAQVLLLERTAAETFRVTVCGLGLNRDYHPASCAAFPKVKYKPLVFASVPKSRVRPPSR